MRNLGTIIEQIQEVTPATETPFLEGLNRIIEGIRYRPPELLWYDWGELSKLADREIPKPVHDWHFKVISLIMDKSVAEIKELFC